MNVKIDTKEKFTVITPKESEFSANMTDDMAELMLPYLSKDNPHIVLNMKDVEIIHEDVAEKIAGLQQQFYEKNASFIICELRNHVENTFKQLNLLDVMNITPTESEAWDILQMEEIEREIMGDFDNYPEL